MSDITTKYPIKLPSLQTTCQNCCDKKCKLNSPKNPHKSSKPSKFTSIKLQAKSKLKLSILNISIFIILQSFNINAGIISRLQNFVSRTTEPSETVQEVDTFPIDDNIQQENQQNLQIKYQQYQHQQVQNVPINQNIPAVENQIQDDAVFENDNSKIFASQKGLQNNVPNYQNVNDKEIQETYEKVYQKPVNVPNDNTYTIPNGNKSLDSMEQLDHLNDHVAAAHFNREGDFNKEYHKEVFLGAKENEVFAERQKYDQARKLREIFTWVDINHDGHINPEELASWVMTKTKEHFDEAQRTNDQRFQSADLDNNSILTWSEFKAGFLYQHGVLPPGITTIKELSDLIHKHESASSHANAIHSMDADFDEDFSIAPMLIELQPDLSYKLSEYQIQWKQSDEDSNGSLNDMEFLDFLHPEYSKGMLSFMVSEILHDMDSNGDGELTLAEFVSLPFGDDIDSRAAEDEWIAARRDEFVDVVDYNKDNVVTVEELERYLDPLNEMSALAEAKQMIGFGDDNENGTLEVDELLKNSEFFTGSKLVDYAKAAHEEF